jgi:tRNA nucleotidyltransferase (CCA-adding enzyme)
MLHGRDLIAVGYEAGPALGELLRQAYQAQLDGAFDTVEGGLAWLRGRAAG